MPALNLRPGLPVTDGGPGAERVHLGAGLQSVVTETLTALGSRFDGVYMRKDIGAQALRADIEDYRTRSTIVLMLSAKEKNESQTKTSRRGGHGR